MKLSNDGNSYFKSSESTSELSMQESTILINNNILICEHYNAHNT